MTACRGSATIATSIPTRRRGDADVNGLCRIRAGFDAGSRISAVAAGDVNADLTRCAVAVTVTLDRIRTKRCVLGADGGPSRRQLAKAVTRVRLLRTGGAGCAPEPTWAGGPREASVVQTARAARAAGDAILTPPGSRADRAGLLVANPGPGHDSQYAAGQKLGDPTSGGRSGHGGSKAVEGVQIHEHVLRGAGAAMGPDPMSLRNRGCYRSNSRTVAFRLSRK
jgi:hypothetical protein